MLYLAAASAIAMAAPMPEGAHGNDAHPAELLTIQEGGMTSDTRSLQGERPGNLATSRGDTITFLSRVVTHLPARKGKSLKTLKELRKRPDRAAK